MLNKIRKGLGICSVFILITFENIHTVSKLFHCFLLVINRISSQIVIQRVLNLPFHLREFTVALLFIYMMNQKNKK